MPPKSQLTVKAQTGLCLGVLLFFSIGLTLAGYMATGQTRDKMAAFASDGATVTGTVTKKYIHSVAKNWVYWLDVRFKGVDGVVHNESCNIANSLWYKYETGGPVKITYAKSNPQWFYVEGAAPTERDQAMNLGMFQYGLIASLLLVIALGVFLFWNLGGGSGPKINIDLAPSQLPSFPSARPRSSFGVRQAPR